MISLRNKTYIIEKLWVLFSLIISAFCYVIFWIWTDWTIEDAMIIARIARNFAEYGILSFNTNSWVSSATSPPFAFMVGLLSLMGIHPIEAEKILGILATLMGGVILYKVSSKIQTPNHAWITATLYMLLPTTVAYTVGGLETPLYTLACMKALFSICQNSPMTALLWGALAVIIRPDGFLVLFITCVGIYREHKEWRFQWAIPAIGVLICYFIIHYGIYGSWLPHSMLAKAQVYQVEPLKNIMRYLERMFFSQPKGLVLYILALYGLVTVIHQNRQYLWLLIWYIVYHLTFMLRAPLFDWYLHPPTFVIAFFSGIAIGEILSKFEVKWFYLLQRYISAYQLLLRIIVILLALLFNLQYAPSKLKYRIYERKVREAAGRWLAEHTNGTELVFTESLGYIGFFCKNPFVDWPGLVDKSIPDLVKGFSRIEGYKRIIETKQPRYLVLRDTEWESLKGTIGDKYEVVAQFPSPFSEYPGYIIAVHKYNNK